MSAATFSRPCAGRRLLAAGLLVLAFGVPATACPVCESDTGRQVRAGLFDDGFTTNLVAAMLPFPALLAIVAAIHGRPSPRLPRADEPLR